MAAKKVSDCNRLTGTNIPIWSMKSRYQAFKKSIEALGKPIEIVKTPKVSSKVEQPAPTPTPEAHEEVTNQTTVAKKISKPVPTSKVSHRLLYYGDGEVMISDFKYLPKSVIEKIEFLTRKKATEEYIKLDLTEYLSEIFKAYGMPEYKGINFEGEIDFKFYKATLIHSLSKGDCFNYPDTYISLVSNSFKRVINEKVHIGHPETEFTVFPSSAFKIKDKKTIEAFNKKLAHLHDFNDSYYDPPIYYQIKEKTYALVSEMAMGTFYTVYECKEKCVKADYHLDYPACGS